MSEFDFDAARRWARAKRIAGQALLLDTCVYIDQMQDRSPPMVGDLIAQRQVNHSMVAIQELMHTVGVRRGVIAMRFCPLPALLRLTPPPR